MRKIPETFPSVTHYRSSFILPLLEETRSDLCSSMMTVSSAPVCEILYIEKSGDYKEPNDLIYDVGVNKMNDAENGKEVYVPENGDLLVLAEVWPKCIGDLSCSNESYKIALVQRKKRFEHEDYDEIQILSSKPIKEQDMQQHTKQKTRFAVFLTNMKTNVRIWKALSLLGEGNMNIIQQVLQTDSSVSLCFMLSINFINKFPFVLCTNDQHLVAFPIIKLVLWFTALHIVSVGRMSLFTCYYLFISKSYRW